MPEGFVKTISLLGGLDTVVNNAGIQVPTAEWKKTFAINTVCATFRRLSCLPSGRGTLRSGSGKSAVFRWGEEGREGGNRNEPS